MKKVLDINAGDTAIVRLHCRHGLQRLYELQTSAKKQTAQLIKAPVPPAKTNN